ncbi:hypothetical protein ACFLEY_00515 [Bradyrhizobium sp. YCK136]|uniref:hypothetical protein n=1 Tax=Bradyrhizobium sp. YCK136 TaxID=3351346 RepID=UPI0037CA47A8
MARSDAKYAIADRFDDAKGEYVGLRLAQLVSVDLNSDAVLVSREAADAQLTEHLQPPRSVGSEDGKTAVGPRPEIIVQTPPQSAPRRPRRFYAKIVLDPNRPTPQVSSIAQSILSELDRVRGTRVTLTLDIDAETTEGFPEDVESVIRDNAASLRIADFGFEGE